MSTKAYFKKNTGVAAPLAADFYVNGQRWNGTALVNQSAIPTADWDDGNATIAGNGMRALSSGAPDAAVTAWYEIDLPAITVASGVVLVDIFLYAVATGTQAADELTKFSVYWNGATTKTLGDLVSEMLKLQKADIVNELNEDDEREQALYERGTETELLRRRLLDDAGDPITNATTFVASAVE